jgi:hypothetical protein
MKDRYFYSIIIACLVAAAALAYSLREPSQIGLHQPATALLDRR